MPVQMYRNHQGGPTVLASDPKGTETVEWQGKGDPGGGDIQPVSEMMQALPQFNRILRRGLIELVPEDSDLFQDADDKQQAHWDSRMNSSQEAGAAAIDHQANNDVIALPCVGPTSRPGETKCGADVTVKDAVKNERPPLCNLHIDLTSQYVPEETVQDGKSVKVWLRTTLAPRERAPQ